MEFLKSSSRVTECVFAAMTDVAAIDVMEALGSCRCCLRRAPDKGLHTPHTHEGSTEIYSDMIKECFNIHLTEGGDTCPGICEVCVGRLRDARAFKAQVQSSQKELKARMEKALQTVDEEPIVKSEIPDDDEMKDILLSSVRASSVSTAGMSASEQLRSDGPHTSETGLATSHQEPRQASQVDYKPLTQKGYLHIHQRTRRTHSEEWNKRYAHKSDLKEYERSHSEEKPFKCKECNKQFTSLVNLRIHERSHSGVKPYKCEQCNKKFTQKSGLNLHARTHSGMKPYKCEECNKRFSNKSNLNIHKITHSGELFTCEECNKLFKTKVGLKLHAIIHNKVNPFRCKKCNTAFTHKRSLCKHEITQCVLNVYKCQECNEKFIHRSNLYKHVCNKHGNQDDNIEFTQKENIVTYERRTKNN